MAGLHMVCEDAPPQHELTSTSAWLWHLASESPADATTHDGLALGVTRFQ